jgi:hypothetical protein
MNKTACIIILSIFAFFRAYSQNTMLLDERNGFQNFKFNTAVSDYYQYNPIEFDEGKYYIGNIFNISIGAYNVERVELVFSNNKLITISVIVDDKDRKKNEEIYNALLELYGNPTENQSITSYYSAKSAQQMEWSGEKVTLKYMLSSYKEGHDLQTKIYLIYSLKTDNKDLKNDL